MQNRLKYEGTVLANIYKSSQEKICNDALCKDMH